MTDSSTDLNFLLYYVEKFSLMTKIKYQYDLILINIEKHWYLTNVFFYSSINNTPSVPGPQCEQIVELASHS